MWRGGVSYPAPVLLGDGLLLVSAALHGAAAVFHALLYRETRRPEHRAFARFTSSLCLYILMNALGSARSGTPLAIFANASLWIFGSIAVAALSELSVALVTSETRTWTATYAGLVTLSLAMIAVVFSTEPNAEASLSGHATQPLALGLMALTSGTAFWLLGRAVYRIAKGSVERRELRGIVLGLTLAVVLGAIDEILRWVTGHRPHISEHAGVFTLVGSTIALADRQVRFASELEEKSVKLEDAHALLARAQHQRGRQEPMAALGELSAVVAHEVRNPLAIVKNAVSSLRRPALAPADRVTLLEIIGEEAGRLNRLVRDLLAFARPRAATESAVQISTLVHRAVRDATRGSAELISRIEVELEGATSLVGDPELLRLALANLVENALHATAEGGKVRVLCRDAMHAGEPSVLLAVHDDGAGMSPDVAVKARDPFFTTRATGTGLGLAIVERVMRSHQGRLSIESEVGRGSKVSLTLPLTRQDRGREPGMLTVEPT